MYGIFFFFFGYSTLFSFSTSKFSDFWTASQSLNNTLSVI